MINYYAPLAGFIIRLHIFSTIISPLAGFLGMGCCPSLTDLAAFGASIHTCQRPMANCFWVPCWGWICLRVRIIAPASGFGFFVHLYDGLSPIAGLFRPFRALIGHICQELKAKSQLPRSQLPVHDSPNRQLSVHKNPERGGMIIAISWLTSKNPARGDIILASNDSINNLRT